MIAAVALAYVTPFWIVMPAIREHRDHRIGVDLSAGTPTSHPLWHSLYIGLGYTANRYGIHYADEYAHAAAEEADPGVAYFSEAYAGVLHKQVDALVEHDPGFVARAEAQKAVVELSNVSRYILLLALLLPAALTAGDVARLRPRELALFAPALALSAIPAILAIPIREYEEGLLASVGTIGLLAIGSVAARAEGEWVEGRAAADGRASRLRLTSKRLLARWPKRATMRALLGAVVILVPAFVAARHLEAEHARWNLTQSTSPTVALATAGAGAKPAPR
jgi:hypothetical protein